jgi:hypothetical protein
MGANSVINLSLSQAELHRYAKDLWPLNAEYNSFQAVIYLYGHLYFVFYMYA